MQDQADGEGVGASAEPAAVWPPRPAVDAVTAESGGEPTDIRAFPRQSGWAVFFLQVVTLGFYFPFWIARTARIIKKVTFRTAVPVTYVWSLIAILVAVFVLTMCGHILKAEGRSDGGTFIIVGDELRIPYAIYYWAIIFRVRGALNSIVEDSSPALGNFSSFGTFFLGPLYLQVRLNQLIRAREREVADV